MGESDDPKPESLPVFCTRNSTGNREVFNLAVSKTVNNGFNDELTPRERKFIRILRGISYGEMVIAVEDRQPVRVEEIKKSIKL